MCVRVQYVTSGTFTPYDAKHNMIQVPAHLDDRYALMAIRKVLSELAVPQPEKGAVCWCGEPVGRRTGVTRQRANGDQVVINYGAQRF